MHHRSPVEDEPRSGVDALGPGTYGVEPEQPQPAIGGRLNQAGCDRSGHAPVLELRPCAQRGEFGDPGLGSRE